MHTISDKSTVPKFPNCWNSFDYDRTYDYVYNKWPKGQRYEGKFFGNAMHGEGRYQWNTPERKIIYEGGFYSNFKEGYAGVSFSDNSYFEGLFIKNQPFGPGIFTYANGRQDVGFWIGQNLVRLSRAVDYIVPRLAPNSSAKIKLLQFRRLIPLHEINRDSAVEILKQYGCIPGQSCTPYSSLAYDPRSFFFDKIAFEETYFLNVKNPHFGSEGSLDQSYVFDYYNRYNWAPEEMSEMTFFSPTHCLCPDKIFVMKYGEEEEYQDICQRKSSVVEYEIGLLAYYTKYGTLKGFHDANEKDMDSLDIDQYFFLDEQDSLEEEEEGKEHFIPPSIVSWNRNDLCTEMLKQIFRFRGFEGKVNFKIAKLMLGRRNAFRRTGEKERQCLHFLKMCSLGPPHIVKEILCSYEISEELMDARGNNGIMFAAATDQHDVIDILADYGVDVNTFNDESLTPLNLCLLRRLAQANKLCNWETAFLPKELKDAEAHTACGAVLYTPYPKHLVRESKIISETFEIGKTKSFSRSVEIKKRRREAKKGKKGAARKKFLGRSKSNGENTQIKDWRPRESISSLDRTFGDGMSANDSKSVVTDESNIIKFCDRKIDSQEVDEKQTAVTDDNKDVFSQVTVFEFESHSGSICSTRSSLMNYTSDFFTINDVTPTIRTKFVPKTEKREEYEQSVRQTNEDQYFFKLGPENKSKEDEKIDKEGNEDKNKFADSSTLRKLSIIDKTIEKLLKRGADPNISEAPKPSLHLAVFTKDVNVVEMLLTHGANPDIQLYPNEGLLTPLHNLVLLKAAPEYVKICELLLNFGADPELETTPEFYVVESELEYLDVTRGRTPLQLLCMRPDLECVDPHGYLVEMAIKLAKLSNKKNYYRGKSYLSLAMMFGNIQLLKAFLQSNLFDQKQISELGYGDDISGLVALDFPTETPCGEKVVNEKEVKSEVMIKFKTERVEVPQLGEKNWETEKTSKKESEEDSNSNVRVAKLAENRFPNQSSASLEGITKRNNGEHESNSGEEETEREVVKKKKKLPVDKAKGPLPSNDAGDVSLNGYGLREKDVTGALETGKKDRKGKVKRDSDEKNLPKRGKGNVEKKGNNEKEKNLYWEDVQDEENGMEKLRGKKDDNENKGGKGKINETANDEDFSGKMTKESGLKPGGNSDPKMTVREKKEMAEQNKNKRKNEANQKGGKESREKLKKGRESDFDVLEKKKQWGEDRKAGKKGKVTKNLAEEEDSDETALEKRTHRKNKKKAKGGRENDVVYKLDTGKRSAAKEQRKENMRKREDEYVDRVRKKGKDRFGKTGRYEVNKDSTKMSKKGELKNKQVKLKYQEKELAKEAKAAKKNVEQKRKVTPRVWKRYTPTSNLPSVNLRTFPEKIRQNLLQMFGNCANIDINEFLLPYVVLRNGDLYYKFKGTSSLKKEQYSLI